MAIVGAGPAGLTLAQLFHRAGIESVILENRNREYVEARIRAGVLEQGVVDLLTDTGVGERMAGERHRIDMTASTGGKTIVVRGQTEVVNDLIEARLETGRPLLFEVDDVRVEDVETGWRAATRSTCACRSRSCVM